MSAAPPTLAWRALVETASAPYQRSGRFAWHFARGKLRWDPVFGHLLAYGLIAPRARVLDIGCGQGLLASLVRAAGHAAHQGRWPSAWAEAPVDAHVRGIDLRERDVDADGSTPFDLHDLTSVVGGVDAQVARLADAHDRGGDVDHVGGYSEQRQPVHGERALVRGRLTGPATGTQHRTSAQGESLLGGRGSPVLAHDVGRAPHASESTRAHEGGQGVGVDVG